MNRREFITLLGAAAAIWPAVARAQQLRMPVIGLLSSVSFEAYGLRVAAFHKGLAGTGFVEGNNVAIEYRSADGRVERLPALATDFVRQNIAVIVTIGGEVPARAAKTATSTIPIVFAVGGDPVEYGLVTSLGRPEANVTGVSFFSNELGPKRLELLRELLPRAGPAASRIWWECREGGPPADLSVPDQAARSIGSAKGSASEVQPSTLRSII